MNEKERLEVIIEAALIANKSAIWWQTEMNACLSELDTMEKDDPLGVSIAEGRIELERKVEYLIVKGQWEDENLDKIMSHMETFEDSERRHVVSEISKRWNQEKRQNDAPPSK